MKPAARLNRSVSQNGLANYGCSSDFQLNEDKMTIKNRLEFKLEDVQCFIINNVMKTYHNKTKNKK